MARKKKPEEHANHERWLVSYADFITLLFATFTALYAISNADKEKFAEMAKSLKTAFNSDIESDGRTGKYINRNPRRDELIFMKSLQGSRPQGRGSLFEPVKSRAGSEDFDPSAGDDLAQEAPRTDVDPSQGEHLDEDQTGSGDGQGPGEGGPLGQLHRALDDAVGEDDLEDALTLRRDSRGLTISLSESAFFETDGVAIKPEAFFRIERIIALLKEKNFNLQILGHTDDRPLPRSSVWQDNVELSALRASRLRQYMVKIYEFPTDMISAAGYGDTQPVAANDTAAGRRQNRRVDIVILDPHDG